ncbi:DUF6261 family protein [Carboxylicivirga marina]|uniref:Uncharacterized protein n=1 Tax=Carboxylicivirga marina TaxID=2800988 RepID=A0ABS1HP86_9BACT|nr:DUF6261 family protein [Carboxylicivirga marina]MBK3519492.1 hypothetical protein [Carboxylicivirga marina]
MRTIPFSLMNVHERFLLLQLIDKILKSKLVALPELAGIYDVIHALRNNMEEALHKSRGSRYTTRIAELDVLQDDGFICFRTFIEAYTHTIINTELRAKANQIEAIIRRHGWSLYRVGVKKQLAISLSLINELMQADNQQLLVELNVVDAFNAWKGAVEQVELLYIEKTETEANQKDMASASELGKQTVDLLEKILPGWNYQSEYSSQPEYKELVEAVYDGAANLETQARTRLTRNQKDTVEE